MKPYLCAWWGVCAALLVVLPCHARPSPDSDAESWRPLVSGHRVNRYNLTLPNYQGKHGPNLTLGQLPSARRLSPTHRLRLRECLKGLKHKIVDSLASLLSCVDAVRLSLLTEKGILGKGLQLSHLNLGHKYDSSRDSIDDSKLRSYVNSFSLSHKTPLSDPINRVSNKKGVKEHFESGSLKQKRKRRSARRPRRPRRKKIKPAAVKVEAPEDLEKKWVPVSLAPPQKGEDFDTKTNLITHDLVHNFVSNSLPDLSFPEKNVGTVVKIVAPSSNDEAVDSKWETVSLDDLILAHTPEPNHYHKPTTWHKKPTVILVQDTPDELLPKPPSHDHHDPSPEPSHHHHHDPFPEPSHHHDPFPEPQVPSSSPEPFPKPTYHFPRPSPEPPPKPKPTYHYPSPEPPPKPVYHYKPSYKPTHLYPTPEHHYPTPEPHYPTPEHHYPTPEHHYPKPEHHHPIPEPHYPYTTVTIETLTSLHDPEPEPSPEPPWSSHHPFPEPEPEDPHPEPEVIYGHDTPVPEPSPEPPQHDAPNSPSPPPIYISATQGTPLNPVTVSSGKPPPSILILASPEDAPSPPPPQADPYPGGGGAGGGGGGGLVPIIPPVIPPIVPAASGSLGGLGGAGGGGSGSSECAPIQLFNVQTITNSNSQKNKDCIINLNSPVHNVNGPGQIESPLADSPFDDIPDSSTVQTTTKRPSSGSMTFLESIGSFFASLTIFNPISLSFWSFLFAPMSILLASGLGVAALVLPWLFPSYWFGRRSANRRVAVEYRPRYRFREPTLRFERSLRSGMELDDFLRNIGLL